MGRKPHPLKDEAIQRIRAGHPYSQIAREVGVAPSAITAWAREIGILPQQPGRKVDSPVLNQRTQEIVDRLLKGEGATQIAADLGVSHQYVYQVKARLSDGDEK